jgi:hypothetical protein
MKNDIISTALFVLFFIGLAWAIFTINNRHNNLQTELAKTCITEGNRWVRVNESTFTCVPNPRSAEK